MPVPVVRVSGGERLPGGTFSNNLATREQLIRVNLMPLAG
jgi:hypothetical protein